MRCGFCLECRFLTLGLKKWFSGSLELLTILLGKIDSDQNMKRVCQNLLTVGFLAILLPGCSIVVFEDGEDCKATKKCLETGISLIEAEENTVKPEVEPEKPESSQTTEEKAEETQLAKKFQSSPPLIDGYVTNFEYDSAEIASRTVAELKAIAAYLLDRTDVKLMIEGHCDERGSRDYNLALGDRRAVALRDVLISNGLEKNRIKTISYGKERPLVVGSTPEVWARNRRAVIREIIE